MDLKKATSMRNTHSGRISVSDDGLNESGRRGYFVTGESGDVSKRRCSREASVVCL